MNKRGFESPFFLVCLKVITNHKILFEQKKTHKNPFKEIFLKILINLFDF